MIRRRRLGLLVAATLLAAACRFERRPDANARGQSPDSGVALPSAAGSPLQDSLRALVAALDDALAAGDVTRLAQLTVPGATLIDQEEGIRWNRENAAGPLPRALRSAGDGRLEWAPTSSEIVPLEDAALLINEYNAVLIGEGVPWKAIETLVLVRTDAGWRVRHLHRSRGQLAPEPPL